MNLTKLFTSWLLAWRERAVFCRHVMLCMCLLFFGDTHACEHVVDKQDEVYFIKSENNAFNKDDIISVKIFTNFFHEDCYEKTEEDIFIVYEIEKNCLN